MTKKKVDKGELYEEGEVEEPEAQTEEKPKRVRGPAVVVSEEDILAALEASGGEAKSGQLRDNINKEHYQDVSSPKLGTAIRKQALNMANAGKIEALHVNGKRTWVFKTKE